MKQKTIIAPSFQLLSNWCSMGCAGCGINTAPPENNKDVHHFSDDYLKNAAQNLQIVKDGLDAKNYQYIMVEQSGGEPAHSPQLVELVGKTFKDSYHKIITNGLVSESLLDYVKSRKDEVMLVLSTDHHKLKYNKVRLANVIKANPKEAKRIHNKVLSNIDLFIKNDIPIAISTMFNTYNIDKYLGFLKWLEKKYPKQIENGTLTPVPVSIVAFGNPSVGKMNPTLEQIEKFERQVEKSKLITIKRTKDWLIKDLIGHYKNKYRFFRDGETIDEIDNNSSKTKCHMNKYMMSFNFQDEEIIRSPKEALFEGFSCGIKVIGNIGHKLSSHIEDEHFKVTNFKHRPSNMFDNHMYYNMSQVEDYLDTYEKVQNDEIEVKLGEKEGIFSEARREMCLLDDYDGIWMPYNSLIQGKITFEQAGEFWSFFRKPDVIEKIKIMQKEFSSKSKQLVGV